MNEPNPIAAKKVVINKANQISIDFMLKVIRHGGRIRPGVPITDANGKEVLGEDAFIDTEQTLYDLQAQGLKSIQIDFANKGRLWDRFGKQIKYTRKKTPPQNTKAAIPPHKSKHLEVRDLFGNNLLFSDQTNTWAPPPLPTQSMGNLDLIQQKIARIEDIKKIATVKYDNAKKNIKKIISEIQDTGGEFNFQTVEETVTDLFNFIVADNSSFSYITREIFSYDDYLYNHSINVCTIGTVILNRFNNHFNHEVNQFLDSMPFESFDPDIQTASEFIYYQPDEMREIAIGFFLHDIGKVLIPQKILNKEGRLTEDEFQVVKTHALTRGAELLEKNKIYSSMLKSISCLHHAALFNGETQCYPDTTTPEKIPPYVKICKLADIYDAMTSKRCYKNAFNPVGVVSDIFHKYADRDKVLQFILHAFVKSIGIYPPGSIVHLKNGQLVYVIDSDGPVVLPITDINGKTLSQKPAPINLGEAEFAATNLTVDRHKALLSPNETYNLLPAFVKEALL